MCQADFSPFYPGDPIDFPVDLDQLSLQARVSSLGYCWPASERWFPELDEGVERCLIGMLLGHVYLEQEGGHGGQCFHYGI